MSEEKKTAMQRIEDLELRIASTGQIFENIIKDMNNIRNAIKLINNKLDATVKAVNQGGNITDDILAKFMIENNVNELKGKIQDMVNRGILESAQEVTEDSFVVVAELDPTGKVVNPRVQSICKQFTPVVKEKLVGALVGEKIPLGDDGSMLEVLEVYSIKQPSVPTEGSSPANSMPVTPTEVPVEATATST